MGVGNRFRFWSRHTSQGSVEDSEDHDPRSGLEDDLMPAFLGERSSKTVQHPTSEETRS